MKNWNLAMWAFCLSILLILSSCDREDPAIIWSGPEITFTKGVNADPSLEENQDRITSKVWITRANSGSIYNAVSETQAGDTPAGTEWAYGTTAELDALTFNTFQATHGNSSPSVVGKDMVLHLIEEDIYIDIKFSQWGRKSQAGGGSFAYTRSTPN
ncbi:MAG: hypothetical protein AAF789_14230 [Bacteroidota bacterium]